MVDGGSDLRGRAGRDLDARLRHAAARRAGRRAGAAPAGLDGLAALRRPGPRGRVDGGYLGFADARAAGDEAGHGGPLVEMDARYPDRRATRRARTRRSFAGAGVARSAL